MVCLAIGTGLGAGIILDGQLYTGATRSAGEVCDLVIDPLAWAASTSLLDVWREQPVVPDFRVYIVS